MAASTPPYYLLPTSTWDRLRWRCLLLSLAGHGLAILLVLTWDSLLNMLQRDAIAPTVSAEKAPTRVVFTSHAAQAIAPQMLPALPALPSLPDSAEALRPRLDEGLVEGQGAGEQGGSGDTIEPPPLPPALALPLPPTAGPGGGSTPVELRLRQEQEANYLLMGFLLRQYRQHWKPVYGHRLPRRSFVLWIEHDNSRVIRASFPPGSTTGIDELDRLIEAYLVEDRRIDLSNLQHSQRELLMTVDLYEAHR